VTIEQQWLQAGLPTHIFRLPGIYGPTRSIFERIRAGQVQNIIKPGHVFSRVHVDDIVQTVEQSMHLPSPGEIYNVADDVPSEPKDLLLEAVTLLQMELPPPIPFETAEFSAMGRSFWNDCRRVSNQKIKEQLGIKLLYPSYREGLRAILKDL
jgi:nucleoside-diphosphate-sugar epimerase